MTLQAPSGRTAVTFSDPSFAAISGFDEPVYALAWSTHRYQNKAGDWECVLPVDNGLIDGVPAHRYLRRGCHLTFTQENNNPLGDPGNEYLMYEGVVQQRNHLSADGSTYLRLAGGLRNLLLSDRSTFYGLTYSGMAANTVAADLVDGNNIIGPNGGILTPGTGILPKMTFKNQSRLAALLKVGEQARWAFRESWDHDRPEFTLIDNPPDSNVVLAKVPYYDPLVHDGFGAAGSGIIADPPSFRYDGQNIVNRIIPIGADEPEGDLTLEFSTLSQPYPILSALAPDGSTYYYIEDEDSIDRYGLVETHLVRTDVKNPSDDAGTRAAAANVLYYVAVGQLLKRKSEIIIVDMPVANGAEIWALPGDKIRLVYTGQVQTAGGAVDWIDTDRFFMVSERHDESDVSGVRRVRFVLQAPDVEMTIPDLPDAIILPPQDTDPYPNPSPDPSDDDFPESPSCCDEPSTDIEPPEQPEPPLPPVITSTPPPTDPPPIVPPEAPLIYTVAGYNNIGSVETPFDDFILENLENNDPAVQQSIADAFRSGETRNNLVNADGDGNTAIHSVLLSGVGDNVTKRLIVSIICRQLTGFPNDPTLDAPSASGWNKLADVQFGSDPGSSALKVWEATWIDVTGGEMLDMEFDTTQQGITLICQTIPLTLTVQSVRTGIGDPDVEFMWFHIPITGFTADGHPEFDHTWIVEDTVLGGPDAGAVAVLFV